MAAGVELEANATDHKLSNQLTSHEAGLQRMLVPTYNLTLQIHFRALQTLYLGPLLDHGSWPLFQSCNSCATTFAVEIWAQLGQRTSTAWKNICCILLLPLR